MKKHILTFFLLALLIVSIPISTLAWISGQRQFEDDRINAIVLANYFYRGNGTEENPYVITTPKHLYNVIWLQNKNYFVDDHGNPKPYYFQIGCEENPVTELDMAGSYNYGSGETGAVPPIGSDTNPFIGYFNGNGATISNLWVSSNPSDWIETPMDFNSVSYHNGVGFFGSIQKQNGDTSILPNNVYPLSRTK